MARMPEPPEYSRRVLPRALMVFAAAYGYLHVLQFQTTTILGADGYYHIKFAELLPSIGFAREFKWAAHSVWATHFADKELLYHVFLVPFARFADPLIGLKYATVLLGAAAVTSFYLVALLNRVRFPLLWTVLLLGSGPYFLYRLGSPRPHVLSLLLLLWCVHLILNRRRVALAGVSFVYALSYTAFHLPLGLALLVSGHRYLTERRFDWKTPAAILGALVLGILVNPYFPNNLRIFWLQNFVVPWVAVSGGPAMSLAREFIPPATRAFALYHLAVLIPYSAALYLALLRPRKREARTGVLFVISLALILMTLLLPRFVEYSVPLTLLFLASFFTDELATFDLREALSRAGRRRKAALAVIGTAFPILAAVLVWSHARAVEFFTPVPPMRREAALYLAEHTEPDELVFTCDWDDGPELFYFNDRNRYPVLLDPNFVCHRDPDRCREWAKVARGGFVGRTYDVLAAEYRYGVCTWDYGDLKRIVEKDPRMEIVLDTPGAYVFRIDRDNPEIKLDDFLELAPDR
jgi:hypothetical protein